MQCLFSVLFIIVCSTNAGILQNNLIVLTGHKTGTEMSKSLMQYFARVHFNSSFVFRLDDGMGLRKGNKIYVTWSYHRAIPLIKPEANSKIVVFLRNPLDVIVSNSRYHQIATEPFLYVSMPYFNNQSYQTYLNTLSLSEQLLFEMSCGVAAETVSHMILAYKYLSQQAFKGQVLYLRLEDFRSNFNVTIMAMIKHFNIESSRHDEILETVQQLSYSAFVAHSNHSSMRLADKNVKSAAIQRLSNRNAYEFLAKMDCVHYSHFDHIFGLDSLNLLPYSDSYQVVRKKISDTCLIEPRGHSPSHLHLSPSKTSQMYVPHNDCACYDISGFKYNFKGCNYSEFDIDLMWITHKKRVGPKPKRFKEWWTQRLDSY